MPAEEGPRGPQRTLFAIRSPEGSADGFPERHDLREPADHLPIRGRRHLRCRSGRLPPAARRANPVSMLTPPSPRPRHPGELPDPAGPERHRSRPGPRGRPSHPFSRPERARGDLPGNGHPPGEGRVVGCRILAPPPGQLRSGPGEEEGRRDQRRALPGPPSRLGLSRGPGRPSGNRPPVRRALPPAERSNEGKVTGNRLSRRRCDRPSVRVDPDRRRRPVNR